MGVLQSKPQMKKLIAKGEGQSASKMLTAACSDCPLRRDALNGWLGGYSPEEYARLCHSDEIVECHVHSGSRCAGLAIYRKNVSQRQIHEHELPCDTETIFATRQEFLNHHVQAPRVGAAEQSSDKGYDELRSVILDFFGDKSRSAADTRTALLALADECAMLAESIDGPD